jgi:hypothetical protein
MNNATFEEGQENSSCEKAAAAASADSTSTATTTTNTTTVAVDSVLSPNACNVKKRTVSDRSPAIKSRKKTTSEVPSVSAPNQKFQSPRKLDIDEKENDAVAAEDNDNKENRTPGPTPYWKVSGENKQNIHCLHRCTFFFYFF